MQSTYQFAAIAPTRAEGELAALLGREGRIHRLTAGAIIQHRGDQDEGFWLIESGRVSICRFAEDGSVTVFGFLTAGDLFGELAHFGGVPRQVDAVAESDAVLIRVGAALIDRLLAEQPNFARWLLKSLASQLRNALNRIESDRNLSAETRVIRAVADLAQRQGPQLNWTQQALADLVGVSRVTAANVLGELAQSGLIELGYRKTIVADLSGLIARANLG